MPPICIKFVCTDKNNDNITIKNVYLLVTQIAAYKHITRIK